MKKKKFSPHVLNEIASTVLTKVKASVCIFLTKKELSSMLQVTTKTIERAGIKHTYSNGKCIYNTKEIFTILENNYTGRSSLSSAIRSSVEEFLIDYTQSLMRIIMIDNPDININSPERWICQDYLIKIGISARKLYFLRKTKKIAYSTFTNSRFYYKIGDIIECFKDIKKSEIEFLIKNSLFYQYISKGAL